MSYRLNEPIVGAIHARLVADLPAAIAARNAEITDGFELTEPAAIWPFVPGDRRLAAAGYNAIGIGDLPSRYTDDIGSSVTGEHELVILVYQADRDGEALAWKIRRMLQVVTELVLRGRNYESVANFEGVGLRRIDPGPTLERERDPELVRTFAAVTIWVRLEDW